MDAGSTSTEGFKQNLYQKVELKQTLITSEDWWANLLHPQSGLEVSLGNEPNSQMQPKAKGHGCADACGKILSGTGTSLIFAAKVTKCDAFKEARF